MVVPARRMSLALLIVAATACGGSASSSHRNALDAGFARKAAAVCRSALADKRAEGPFPYPDFNPTQPDPARLADVADFLEKTATTFATWHERMLALGEPRRGAGAWHRLVAAIGTHVELTRDQIDAARAGDAGRFAEDYARGVETQDRLLAAATAAGVPHCADVDR